MADDAAWAPRPRASSAAGPVLPGFRDLRVLARGGDSVVYRAHQHHVGRDVAIKVVHLDDADSIARFRRELDITVRLGRQHPHIVTVLAVGETPDGLPYLVMDLVEAGSLHDRLVTHGPLAVAEVCAAGSVVADALSFAHGQGVLHRDVKPQNVLVLPTSYVLADFGLARAIDAGHSASLERFSYRHASPQVLDGEPPTVADDVWSLGSTLFTLLDGRAPFAADDPDEDGALAYLRRARTGSPRRLEREDVPPALEDVLARCLARDPAERFASAAELGAALDGVPTEARAWEPVAVSPPPVAAPAPEEPEPVAVSALAHLPSTAPATGTGDATGLRPVEPEEPGPPPAPPARPSRRRLVVLGGVVVLAAAAGVGIGLLRGGDEQPQGRRSSSPAVTGTDVVIAVPTVTGTPTGTTAGPSFDAALAPRITTAVRRGDRVDLRWTDPTRGSAPFVVFLDDGAARQVLGSPPAGQRSATLTGFPAGRHCLRVATVTTSSTGRPVFGLSPRSCVAG